MNKRPDDHAPTDIVPVDAPQVPAIKKPPNGFRLHRILTDHADGVLDRSEELDAIERKLLGWKPGHPLPDARDAQVSDYEPQLKRARELLKKLDPADAYEDEIDDDIDAEIDCEDEPRLKRKYIAKRLALMIAAMPTGKAGTPDGYVKMLLEHVADADVCALSLEGACRELEETQKFLPTISEVLTAIREHRNLWRRRQYALRNLQRTSERLQGHFERLRARVELEMAKQAHAEARGSLNHWLAVLGRREEDAAARQEEARKAYERVEQAMAAVASVRQQVDEKVKALGQACIVLAVWEENKEAACQPSQTSRR